MSKETFLRFHLEHSTDEDITCLFCGYRKCEQGFFAGGQGRLNFYGVHESCAEKHMAKLTQTSSPG